MSRFSELFARKKALGVYLTVGDPDPDTTFACADAAIAAGADFLELGMPFSDPSADGPVIQRAMERALARGTTLDDVFSVAERVRAKHPQVPILLFGYANPFYQKHRKGLLAPALKKAQIDALLLVDVPVEHREPFAGVDVDLVCLLGPNATDERVALAAKNAHGFIYLVAIAGVTGAAQGSSDVIAANVKRLKALTQVPVCVGFGVRTGADAQQMAAVADGVIAGSVFVDQIGGRSEGAAERVAAKVRELRLP